MDNIPIVIEKLKYIESCIEDDNSLFFESVHLSQKDIDDAFQKDNQKLIKQLLDLTTSLSKFPINQSIVERINFLTQLFHEYDYCSSPACIQWLSSSQFIEWNPVLFQEKKNKLRLPHLYHRFNVFYPILYKSNTVNFQVNPSLVVISCCSSLVFILQSFIQDDVQLTPSETMLFQDIISYIMTLVIKPIVDVFSITCQKIVTQSFNQCFKPFEILYSCLYKTLLFIVYLIENQFVFS